MSSVNFVRRNIIEVSYLSASCPDRGVKIRIAIGSSAPINGMASSALVKNGTWMIPAGMPISSAWRRVLSAKVPKESAVHIGRKRR